MIMIILLLSRLFQFLSSLDRRPHQLNPPRIHLLSLSNTTKISTDVRGNLGPPEVLLDSKTQDWIKDRWQAASDMHGTAIRGYHWILLEFQHDIYVDSIVLDWEAAYSNNYQLDAAGAAATAGGGGGLLSLSSLNNTATSSSSSSSSSSRLFDTDELQLQGRNKGLQTITTSDWIWEETTQGQSPGVKTKTPLHVVHTIRSTAAAAAWNTRIVQPPQVHKKQQRRRRLGPYRYVRLTIRSSAMGWGVSLWHIQVYGWFADS